jgi:hypothetical protein
LRKVESNQPLEKVEPNIHLLEKDGVKSTFKKG